MPDITNQIQSSFMLYHRQHHYFKMNTSSTTRSHENKIFDVGNINESCRFVILLVDAVNLVIYPERFYFKKKVLPQQDIWRLQHRWVLYVDAVNLVIYPERFYFKRKVFPQQDIWRHQHRLVLYVNAVNLVTYPERFYFKKKVIRQQDIWRRQHM